MKQARLVKYAELYRALYPYVADYKWGRDSIYDLWLKGAPVPQDKCPGGKACSAYPKCKHIRRVLLPNHLEDWWADVSNRISLDISASEAIRSVGSTY